MWTGVIIALIALGGPLIGGIVALWISSRDRGVTASAGERTQLITFYREELVHCRSELETWRTLALRGLNTAEGAIVELERLEDS